MTVATKKKLMSLPDHLLREATLLDYAMTTLAPSISSLNVIALNYSTPFVKYFGWATALVGLQHQMGALSLSLSSMASLVSKPTRGPLLTSSEAYMIYCNLREAKNES